MNFSQLLLHTSTASRRLHLKRDGTRAGIRFRLSPKRTSPFKSAGASVQSTAGSRDMRISVINAGYTTFRGSVRVLATHSTRQLPLHFPSRASLCAIRFQTHSTQSPAVKGTKMLGNVDESMKWMAKGCTFEVSFLARPYFPFNPRVQTVSGSKAGPLSLLCGARNFGKICSQAGNMKFGKQYEE